MTASITPSSQNGNLNEFPLKKAVPASTMRPHGWRSTCRDFSSAQAVRLTIEGNFPWVTDIASSARFEDESRPDPAPVDLSSADRAERARLVGELFREHNRALVSFLRTKLHNDQEAREVAQEAYVKLLQLESPGVVSFLQAYLFKIATNIAIDRIRHQAVGDRLAREQAHFFDEVDEAASPERKVLAQDELERISKAMESLPEKCRQAFALHVLQEHPVSEVAAEMKLTTRMVRYYVVRGLELCRDVRKEKA